MGSQEDISSELMRKSWVEIATEILVYVTSVFTMKFCFYIPIFLFYHLSTIPQDVILP
jgi:hypothetical protein